MKILAMYLPQFHRTKENDEWWGDGFTEWTTVKGAEKIFPSHDQPHIPLNDNYYDLLDRNTMIWQAKLLHKYKLDGLCFYHYYFKDGRKILEKPAENLLKWQDIDMPFCFSWANESWVRSWSKISDANTWSAKFEPGYTDDMSDSGLLLEQSYGFKDDWMRHYRYLSQFFKDERYIKYNNMPVFMIYKPKSISCIKDMLICWDELAIADGFDGIYTIGTCVQDAKKYGLKDSVYAEPGDTISKFFTDKYNNDDNVMKSIDYRDIWGKILSKPVEYGYSLGGVVSYDDTPRRGNGGVVIRNRSPFVFYESMKGLIDKAYKNKSAFIFVNAWNEWGEGMHLEPDKEFGYQFLEAILQARNEVTDRSIDFCNNVVSHNNVALKSENMSLLKTLDRYRGYWTILDAILNKIESGQCFDDYFVKNKYQNIAVYGYGMLGKHLLYQLKKSGIDVSFIIDQDENIKTKGIRVFKLDNNLPAVDLIVVTVVYDYESIKKKLQSLVCADIVSISEIL